MGLPVRTFWFLNYTIDRIQADEDRRNFRVANNAQGGEQAEEYLQSLHKSVGAVYDVDEVGMALNQPLDREGLHSLRALAG